MKSQNLDTSIFIAGLVGIIIIWLFWVVKDLVNVVQLTLDLAWETYPFKRFARHGGRTY